jgi:heme/copper-type cytochrome/quinol oxidase subunit 1
MINREILETVGFTVVLCGVFILILTGVVSCMDRQMADQCENRWSEAYEWKYVHIFKINGKWVPEDILIDRKGAK